MGLLIAKELILHAVADMANLIICESAGFSALAPMISLENQGGEGNFQFNSTI